MKKLGFILCVALTPFLAFGVTLDPLTNSDVSYKTKINSNDALLNTGKIDIDGTVPLTAAWDIGGEDLIGGGVITLLEQAAAIADVPGSGQLWVKTASPNELWFTDDAGTDVQLGVGGGGSGDLLADGTIPLTANWDVGAFKITALTFESDQATGTAPFTVASTTVVTNLNADTVDGVSAAAFGLVATDLSQFAATTSAQLAGVLSNETGTGLAVFGTSPTLVTPALGTPSALVGTNISGTAASLTAGTATTANALESATTTVSVSAATAPSVGQVLKATSSTTATWQTLSGTGDLLADGTVPLTANWDVGTFTITAGGFTLGLNELLTMNSETLKHDGTDFVFSDSLSTTAVTVSGDVTAANAIFTEKAAQATPVAGFGEIWVKNTTPNTAFFTDDAGTNFPLGSGISAANILMARIAGSTYSTVQDLQDTFHSAGATTGGTLTDDTDGTVTVSAGNGFIRATNSNVAEVVFADWAAESGANVALVDNDMNYLYVEYNSGTPQVIATITKRTDEHTNILLGTIYREGTTLHLTGNTRSIVGDHALNMIIRLRETVPFARVSGGVISETGTRNVAITAGDWWEDLTEFTTTAKDTAVADTFTYYYDDGAGGWTSVTSSTQIDNLQYDDGTGSLATLSNSRYGNHWVYLSQDDDLIIVYGTTDGTLSVANAAAAPTSLPPQFAESHVRLIGKVVIGKSDAAFTSIQSAFDTSLSLVTVTSHGDLSDLGNDDHTQYLRADGTRALTGAWDMGSFSLTNVNIDSGVITGITDLAVADGGTGVSTSTGTTNVVLSVSPVLTGTPAIAAATATTAAAGTDSTHVATTAFVNTATRFEDSGSHTTPTTTNPLAPTWDSIMNVIWYGATGEIDLPVATSYPGRSLLIYNTGAFTITVDPNVSEVIVRDGTVQTGGVSFTLDSGAGNFVALISDGVRWITLGFKGVLAEGS